MIRFVKREDISMNEDNIKILNEVFVDVSLTEAEERSLQWLSGWEQSTFKNTISAFKKLEHPCSHGKITNVSRGCFQRE